MTPPRSSFAINALGYGLLCAVFALAGANGLTRLDHVLYYGPLELLSVHGALALGSFVAGIPALLFVAVRAVAPARETEAERNSTGAVFRRQFAQNRTGMIGLYGVLVLVALTLLTPMITPYDPDQVDFADKLLAPGWHPTTDAPTALLMPMGTDEYGRDLFSRVLFGGRISLVIGLVAVAIAATIGVFVGATAGYAAGFVDRVLMWFVDLLLSLPSLVLLLAIVGLFRPKGVESIFLIVTILGLTSWMSVSRIVRSQVLSLKEQEFVQAARALGLSPARIVARHLIPNALAPVIVYCSLAVGAVILSEASLSFLGLGVAPPTSTWGTLVGEGKDHLMRAPWIVAFPGLAILAAVMSFNLLGDGLRDALDPKLRGR